MMYSFKIIVLQICLLFCGQLLAQRVIDPVPENWTTYNSQVTFDGDIIYLTNKGKGSALLWLNNVGFKNGIVELDIKGKDVSGQSFLGLAFHGLDDKKYDAVYFRPFNFKSNQKGDNAIQYIDSPRNQWDVLRKKFPGKYESSVESVSDPDDWFHAKIMINYPEVKVYVNNAREPALVVEQISKRQAGRIGLWIDSDDGSFKKLVITDID